jgi:hypothetical protein
MEFLDGGTLVKQRLMPPAINPGEAAAWLPPKESKGSQQAVIGWPDVTT